MGELWHQSFIHTGVWVLSSSLPSPVWEGGGCLVTCSSWPSFARELHWALARCCTQMPVWEGGGCLVTCSSPYCHDHCWQESFLVYFCISPFTQTLAREVDLWYLLLHLLDHRLQEIFLNLHVINLKRCGSFHQIKKKESNFGLNILSALYSSQDLHIFNIS